MEKLMWLKAEKIIEEVARICHSFCAKEVILYGSRAKGTAQERSDIDIAVSGVEDFESLTEQIENLPTLFSVDIVNMVPAGINYYWRYQTIWTQNLKDAFSRFATH